MPGDELSMRSEEGSVRCLWGAVLVAVVVNGSASEKMPLITAADAASFSAVIVWDDGAGSRFSPSAIAAALLL